MAKLRIEGKRHAIEGVLTTSASSTGVSDAYSGFAITLCAPNEKQNSSRERDYYRLKFDRAEAEYLVKHLREYLDTRLDAYLRPA